MWRRSRLGQVSIQHLITLAQLSKRTKEASEKKHTGIPQAPAGAGRRLYLHHWRSTAYNCRRPALLALVNGASTSVSGASDRRQYTKLAPAAGGRPPMALVQAPAAPVGFPCASSLFPKKIWLQGTKIPLQKKLFVYEAQVVSVLMYNCGSWSAPKHVLEIVATCQRKHRRTILNIRYPGVISNHELYRRCQDVKFCLSLNEYEKFPLEFTREYFKN